jgi:hypothetical protein
MTRFGARMILKATAFVETEMQESPSVKKAKRPTSRA